MQIPALSEASHPLVKSLSHYSDQELLTLFQRHPDAGQYFAAIYCRYSPLVYTLIRHSARSPVQADYLFAHTWRHVFHELGGLSLDPSSSPARTLQSWIINVTAVCINQAELPPVESINYSLQSAPPPLWCYVERALDQLSPVHRLMILMAQTFHWSETRISAYLQAEGEQLAPKEVKAELQKGYRGLEEALPEDIRAIYLNDKNLAQRLQTEQNAAALELDLE